MDRMDRKRGRVATLYSDLNNTNENEINGVLMV